MGGTAHTISSSSRLSRSRRGTALQVAAGVLLLGILLIQGTELYALNGQRDQDQVRLAAVEVADATLALMSALQHERSESLASMLEPDGLVSRGLAAARESTDAAVARLAETASSSEPSVPDLVAWETQSDLALTAELPVLRETVDRRSDSADLVLLRYAAIIQSSLDTLGVISSQVGGGDTARDVIGLALVLEVAERIEQEGSLLMLASMTEGQPEPELIDDVEVLEARRQSGMARIEDLLPETRVSSAAVAQSRQGRAFQEVVDAFLSDPSGVQDAPTILAATARHARQLRDMGGDLAQALEDEARESLEAAQGRIGFLAFGLGLAAVLAVIQGGLAVSAFRGRTREEAQAAEAEAELALVVGDIQRELLTPAPAVLTYAHLEMRYEPASQYTGVGGDWFDVFEIGPGRLVITMGDVFGHGVETVAAMHRLRHIIRCFTYEGHRPGEVLRLSDEHVRHFDEDGKTLMSTVWLGVLDSSLATLHFASAGHPPAILAMPGRDPVLLEVPVNPPIGAGNNGHAALDQTMALTAGSRLLVYTDGVIESRGELIDQGMMRASTILSEQPPPPLPDQADRIIRSRADPERDDAALVLLSYHP